jgi:hypothetical protein
MVSLVSCAPGGSELAHVNECTTIPLASYTPAQQSQVADEMDAAAAGAEWVAFIRDYGRERTMLRACAGVKP